MSKSIKKIPANEVKRGMYVTKLDRDWLDSPFLFQGFSVDNDDERDTQIVRTAIDLGHTFGFGVVAEGVESLAIRNAWIDMKCDMEHGYLYSPALPQQEFIKWLNQYQPNNAVQPVPVCSEVR